MTIETEHDLMSINDFVPWLKTAQPDETVVYYVGDLAYDREFGDQEHYRNINAVANAAYAASENKEVCLTQKRLEKYRYEYRATRRAFV